MLTRNPYWIINIPSTLVEKVFLPIVGKDTFLLRKVAMTNKIIIIEDDQAISQMYKLKFETEGYIVFTANNGKEGLKLCEQKKPDIILLDLMMPIMRGDEMLAKLRKTEWGKNMKVVVLTNISESKLADKVHSLGVLDVLTKAQFTPTEVVDKIGTLLKL